MGQRTIMLRKNGQFKATGQCGFERTYVLHDLRFLGSVFTGSKPFSGLSHDRFGLLVEVPLKISKV